MVRKRIASEEGRAAVRTGMAGGVVNHREDRPDRETLALAVRYLLQLLSDTSPGNTVEVRVPPFGAVQCVSGPKHTRGTPPNVVEMTPAVWLDLATGVRQWGDALAGNLVTASGSRATLEQLLPLHWDTAE